VTKPRGWDSSEEDSKGRNVDERANGGGLEVVRDILAELNQRGLPILQLRHRDLMSLDAFSGDHDFLLDRRRRTEVVRSVLGALVDRRRFFLLHSPVHPTSRKSTFHVLDEPTGRFVTLEFWHEVVVRTGGRYGRLTWHDLEPVIVRLDGGFALDDTAGPLLFLTHLHSKDKQLEGPLVEERLRGYRDSLPSSPTSSQFTRDVTDLIDDVLVGRISIEGGSDQALRMLTGLREVRLRWRRLDLRRRRLLVDGALQARRRFTRHCVAVVGPDGSGKSTAVEAIAGGLMQGTVRTKVFKRLFRDRLVYKLFLRWQLATTRERRNLVDERVGGWLALLALPPFLAMVLRERSCTLVFDRYFYDFLMVNVRRPDSGPVRRPIRQRLLRCVPRPGLVFNPLADHEATVGRRDALSDSGFRSYEGQLLDFMAARPPTWFAHAPTKDNVGLSRDFVLRAVSRARVGRLSVDVLPSLRERT
jgi:hypothetical protein